MEFFSDKPTYKWTCNEVCDYYRSKNKDKDQSLGEILCEIKKDLKTNLSNPNLLEQSADILNNWNTWTRNSKRADKRKKQQAIRDQRDSINSNADVDIERIEKIVDSINKCTADVKAEFRTEIIKLYYAPEEDSWEYQYNAINTAKNFLEAERYLTQAREVLFGSSI